MKLGRDLEFSSFDRTILFFFFFSKGNSFGTSESPCVTFEGAPKLTSRAAGNCLHVSVVSGL